MDLAGMHFLHSRLDGRRVARRLGRVHGGRGNGIQALECSGTGALVPLDKRKEIGGVALRLGSLLGHLLVSIAHH